MKIWNHQRVYVYCSLFRKKIGGELSWRSLITPFVAVAVQNYTKREMLSQADVMRREPTTDNHHISTFTTNNATSSPSVRLNEKHTQHNQSSRQQVFTSCSGVSG